MTIVQPQGDALKKAIQWISQERKKNPDINLAMLVDQTAFKFDLSPRDSEFLLRFVTAKTDP
jgi:hypothetical protein